MIKIQKHIWVAEKYKSLFDSSKSIDVQSLFWDTPGKLVRAECEKSIYFFCISDNKKKYGFYLKQERPKLFTHFKYLLKNFKLYRFRTRHELDLLRLYKAQGVSVVEPVAWGEQYVLGIPIRGFLVQREVKGKEFINLVKTASAEERIKLIQAYGKFVADLHSKGLISTVARVTDLICTSRLDEPWDAISFVVIDRESGPLEIESFSTEKVALALASMLVRFFIYIDPPSNREVNYFLHAYLDNLDVADSPSFRSIYLLTSVEFTKMKKRYSNEMN